MRLGNLSSLVSLFVALPLSQGLISCLNSPAPPQENILVLLGSSTAAGIGATNYDSSWAGKFQASLDKLDESWRLVNLAVSGYTTYHVLPTTSSPPENRPRPDPSHNVTKALSLRPRGIIVNLPSNDISGGFPFGEQQANFLSLEMEANVLGVPIWICSPQPRSAFDSTQRKALIELRDWIQTRFAPRVVDFWTQLASADGSIDSAYDSGDGIHLNDRGHQLLFSRIVDAHLIGRASSGPIVVMPSRISTRLPAASDSFQMRE